MREVKKKKKRNKVIKVVSYFIIIFTVFYMIHLNMKRAAILDDNANIKFTIGEVIDFKYGAKTSPWFVYKFFINGIEYKNNYSISDTLRKKSGVYLKSFIGKSFFVKYNVIKPKFNQMYLNKSVSDSLTNSKNHTWNKIPDNGTD